MENKYTTNQSEQFKDKIFIVTGSTQGSGAETAKLLASRGAKGITICGRNEQKGNKVKDEILKLGSEGALLHLDDGSAGSKTDRLAPINVAPKDVAGAGDSMMMSTMLGFVAGADVWQAACIGGVSAALQISRVGNVPLQKNELLDCLK